ncbi:MAG: peptidoglycan recognition protein family protein [Deltaproteobacteria bacterium]|nr:peptidoglycan recognition protein family protein [Deltaproteobacteria bacterium]
MAPRAWILLAIAACGGDRATIRPPTAGADDAGARDASTIDAAPIAAAVIDAPAPIDAALAPDPGIVDWPIAWSDERERLTLEYRRAHVDPDARDLTITPRMIVLHYTSGRSAKGTHGYFDNLRLEASRTELARGGAVNVSAHFLVERDGTIYRIQPETRMARHCIGLNDVALGVENVGDPPDLPLTAAQVAADAALIRYLVARHPTITTVIGHYESAKFEGTPLWTERDPKYRNDKPDPGKGFMRDVRAAIADLGLAGAP